MRRVLLLAAVLVLAAPAVAHAGGGGLSASYGGRAITGPDGKFGYIAVPARHDSVVQVFHDGLWVRWRTIDGAYGVPQAAFDGTKTGLSRDGRTLVLGEIPDTYPVRRTRLLVLAAPSLKIKQRITLKGWYCVDGISPNGETIYLVHYTRPTTNPSAYEVVAYAPGDGSSRVIMDPDEPGEEMEGTPLSRVTSADGNFEFTLVDDPEEPFIHRLDVAAGTAECIDLPQLKGADLASTTLSLDGGSVAIGDLAKLDPETQAVTLTAQAPAATSTPRPRAIPAPPPSANGTSPWPFVAFGLLAIGAVTFLVARRRSVHEVEDLHVTVHHADEHPALRE
jgi:hypothetical protein